MKRRSFVIGASGLFLGPCVGLISGCASVGQTGGSPGGARLPHVVRYGFVLTNPQASSLEKQVLWFYAPLRRTAHQNLDKLTINIPHEETTDSLGHHLVMVKVPEMTPFSTRLITVEAEFFWDEAPRKEALLNRVIFLEPEKFIETGAPEIVKLSVLLKKETDKETAISIYSWVKEEVKYAGYIANDLGALYAVKERRGDCTEYAYLVCALARSNGIPARVIGGYVVAQSSVLRPEDYHNWAELYYDGKWNIVDAQKRVIGSSNNAYVAFEVVSSSNSNSMKGAHRYRVEGEMKVLMS